MGFPPLPIMIEEEKEPNKPSHSSTSSVAMAAKLIQAASHSSTPSMAITAPAKLIQAASQTQIW